MSIRSPTVVYRSAAVMSRSGSVDESHRHRRSTCADQDHLVRGGPTLTTFFFFFFLFFSFFFWMRDGWIRVAL